MRGGGPRWGRGRRAEGAGPGARKPELTGSKGGDSKNPLTPQDLGGSAGHREPSG